MWKSSVQKILPIFLQQGLESLETAPYPSEVNSNQLIYLMLSME